MKNKSFITIKINKQLFGLDMSKISSLHGAKTVDPSLVPVPFSPKYVRGVAKFYEELLQVWNLNSFFDMPEEKTNLETYIVFELEDKKVALYVPEVVGVQKAHEGNFKTAAGTNDCFILENNQIISILKEEELFKTYQEKYAS